MFLALTFERKVVFPAKILTAVNRNSRFINSHLLLLHITAELRLSVHLLNVKTQLYLIKTNYKERKANDDTHFLKIRLKIYA